MEIQPMQPLSATPSTTQHKDLETLQDDDLPLWCSQTHRVSTLRSDDTVSCVESGSIEMAVVDKKDGGQAHVNCPILPPKPTHLLRAATNHDSAVGEVAEMTREESWVGEACAEFAPEDEGKLALAVGDRMHVLQEANHDG